MAKEKKMKYRGTGLILLFLLILSISMAGYLAYYFWMPNFQQQPLHKFSNLSEDEIYIVYQDEILATSTNPIMKDGLLYLPVDFLQEKIDPYLYWDSAQKRLTMTTETDVFRYSPDKTVYTKNGKPFAIEQPILMENEMVYMPLDLVQQLYPVEGHFDTEYNLLMLDLLTEDRTVATVKGKEVPMRYEGNRKSIIQERLTDAPVVVFDQDQNYTRVRTEKGLIGYVETKRLVDEKTIAGIVPQKEERMQKNVMKEKINLLWDQSKNPPVNADLVGVNVLSPKWFSLDEKALDGAIEGDGNKAYVTWAHQNGIQVWALVADTDAKTVAKVLSSTNGREKLIGQLLYQADKLKLDGINIDFEKITADSARDYLQFLRELNPLMLEKGLMLSADVYVPTYTKYYQRDEMSKVVDYICVMTYDEHTGVSEKAGPVASYGFVEDGILQTLKEVPKDKLIMGIPFYSRIWKNDKIIGAYGMKEANRIFQEKGAEFQWLEDLKLYYATYTEIVDGKEARYEVWLEDVRAIEEKMQLFQKYDLAGVACWVNGLQGEEVFEMIQSYLK